jgi:uncharacterized protein Veg
MYQAEAIIKIETGRKRPAQRAAALVFCVLFMVAFIFSSIFIFTYQDHEHDHNGPDGSCATCAHLMAAKNLIKSFSAALVGATLVFGCLAAILFALRPIDLRARINTLIRLKVRLNN